MATAPGTQPERPQHDEQPKPPFPPQHQEKPGIEAKMTPRPEYHAPNYKPAGKLEGRVALVTGGDSGIGRAIAVLSRVEARTSRSYTPKPSSAVPTRTPTRCRAPGAAPC